MGTRFEIVLVRDLEDGVDERQLRAAGDAAVEEILEWHRRLTRFEPDSFISHLKRTAWLEPVRLDDDMLALFADAIAVWRDSDGAFDITAARSAVLVAGGLPPAGNSRNLVLDHVARTIHFADGPMSLDFGAIGKGHALDCAAALLRRHGITRAFLHGGTSSGLGIGDAGGGAPWRVALGSDDGPVIALKNEAFSVSDTHSQTGATGDGHIIDPRERLNSDTSAPRVRVAVTGPSARLADAWSTALAVLGKVPAAFPRTYTARWL